MKQLTALSLAAIAVTSTVHMACNDCNEEGEFGNAEAEAECLTAAEVFCLYGVDRFELAASSQDAKARAAEIDGRATSVDLGGNSHSECSQTVSCVVSCKEASIMHEDPDMDGDGWTFGDGDCDDANPETYPGAPEVYDGVDNDCDTEVDLCGPDHLSGSYLALATSSTTQALYTDLALGAATAGRDFTLALWVRDSETSSGYSRLLSVFPQHSTETNGSFWVFDMDRPHIELIHRVEGIEHLQSIHGNDTNGSWTHLVFSIDLGSRTATVWQNGDKVAEKPIEDVFDDFTMIHPEDAEEPVFVLGSGSFAGDVDDLQIFSNALEANEVWDLYCHQDLEREPIVHHMLDNVDAEVGLDEMQRSDPWVSSFENH